MIKKIISLTILISLSIGLIAQKYTDFSFNPDPKFDMTKERKEEVESILNKVYSVEFNITENSEEQYVYIYTAKWINSDEAIEKNNRIYLAENRNSEYLYQKSRIILPNGDIRILKEEDIKEGVYGEGENQRKYYYYAVEGLEKGSIIESAS